MFLNADVTLAETGQRSHAVSGRLFYTSYNINAIYDTVSLQCFDAVGWAAGRASGL